MRVETWMNVHELWTVIQKNIKVTLEGKKSLNLGILLKLRKRRFYNQPCRSVSPK